MLRYANWELRHAYELSKGRVVNITNDISIDKRSIATNEGGIYTAELGKIIDTDHDLREFSCECGALYGRFYEGEVCEECNTVVAEQYGADIRRLGWIDIAPYFIINPAAYEMLSRVIGIKVLPNVISYSLGIDLEGNLKTVSMTNIKSPYENIGMIEFRRRFKEVVTYYGTSRGFIEEMEYLLKNEDAVFSTKIPVMSTYLRPTFLSSKSRKVAYDNLNATYMKIVSSTKLLRSSSSNRVKTATLSTVAAIQGYLQELYDQVIRKKLSGKYKIIRSLILGSRLSFSARFVIVSLNGVYSGLDHVEMSYKGFLELYFLEILNAMKRGYGDPNFANMTVYELYEILMKAKYSNEVDERVYAIMELFIKKRGDTLRVLINRNPTLDLGSIQCMKIVHITKDAKKSTLGIPLTSLKGLNGDFDGDVLNVFSLKEKRVIEAFNDGFNPRHLVVDRTGDGYFNKDFGLIKDMLTNLFTFMAPMENHEE